MKQQAASILLCVGVLSACGGSDGADSAEAATTTELAVSTTTSTVAVTEPPVTVKSGLDDSGDLEEFCGSIVTLQELINDDDSETSDFLDGVAVLSQSAPAEIADDTKIAADGLQEILSIFEAMESSADADFDAIVESLTSPQEDLFSDFAGSLALGEPIGGDFSTVLEWANEECEGFPLEPLPEREYEALNVGAELFVDPEGDYQIEVDPEWPTAHGTFISGVELWVLGEHPVTPPSINILSQDAPGMTLADYTELSVTGGAALDGFELLGSGAVEGHIGQEIGFMEYRAIDLHLIAYFVMVEGKAVVATVTAVEEEFASTRALADPYVLTLVGLQ